MIRIRRLLAAAATSALLLLGAIIALEALGLLFQKEAREPVIANVHMLEVPEDTAPALLWKQLEEQARSKAKAEKRRLEAGQKTAALTPPPLELAPPPLEDVPWLVYVQPAPQQARKAPQQAREVKATATVAEPEQDAPKVHRVSARRERARSMRRGAGRPGSTGCPFLALLETIMGPPAPARAT